MHTENKIVTKKKKIQTLENQMIGNIRLIQGKNTRVCPLVIVRNDASEPFPLSLIERVKQILIVMINELDIVFT